MENKILVGILIGSESDLPVINDGVEVLKEFGIGYELLISSAHRTPERTAEYAKTAATRGIEVIIAAAGGAAHLPGVVASLTPLPVIGVPIQSKSLGGLDSLLSIAQMPAGIPVATVAIDGARNAAILSAEILGIKYPEIRQKVLEFKKKLAEKVIAANEKLKK